MAGFAAVGLLAGCNGGTSASMFPSSAVSSLRASTVPIEPQSKKRGARRAISGFVYVTNRTSQGGSQLQVYQAGVENPSPIRTITTGLSNVGGVDVDPSGDVYVANGGDGDVLEYSPGAISVIDTYSRGLVNPVAVAVANNTLYVSDRGNGCGGQQVVEYPVGNPNSPSGVAGPGGCPSSINAGVTVEPDDGNFWTSASSLTAIPPSTGCPGSDLVAKNVLPTLWVVITLSNNAQAWGLAFDSGGNLYASDFCNNDVNIYSGSGATWNYTGKVPGTFNAPLFQTIHNEVLAVPSAGNAQSVVPGYATVIDLTDDTAPMTITNGLQHPVGAAVGAELAAGKHKRK